jgi:pimeloyl-ACP methyl ester carboxylesterase
MSWEFIYRGETRDVDQATRSSADGSFVHLSHGWTHYQDAGVTNPGPVVLVHGFSVPYFIWDPTFTALATAGLHPIRYDLYGRGYSDRPRVNYDMDLFVEQLGALLEALQLPTIDLIGLSMGGAIAAAFTARNPARVRRLILIDPSGAEAVPMSVLYRLAVLPWIGEVSFGLLGTGTMVRAAAADFFDAAHIRLFQDQYRIQMQYRGFKRAILSSIRHHMLQGFPDVYRQLGRLDTPVLLVWGQNDQTVPFEQSRRLLAFMPRATFQAIPNCGHIPHFEQPAMVNPKIIGFLRDN